MTLSENSLEYFLRKTDLPSYSWITSEKMIENIRKKPYKFVSHFRYVISHDGYDRYGPQSDIHDIYIWYKEEDKFYIDRYHTEEWFVEGSKPVFTLDCIYQIKTEKEWKEKQKLDNRELGYKL